MTKRTFRILVIPAIAALVATAGLTFAAMNGGSDDDANSVRHRHQMMAHHQHGASQVSQQNSLGSLIELLDLTPDQRRHIERVQQILGAEGGDGSGSMAELHERLMEQFERGRMDTGEIRQVIDGQVEKMRTRAYAVTDELIALANGLDSKQRETLLAHLRQLHERRQGS